VATAAPAVVPERVTVDGARLFDLLVSLIRIDNLGSFAAKSGADVYELGLFNATGEAINDLHHAAFGPMFVDTDGPELDDPDCFNAVFLAARAQALATPLRGAA
jgi:hypothetical protein